MIHYQHLIYLARKYMVLATNFIEQQRPELPLADSWISILLTWEKTPHITLQHLVQMEEFFNSLEPLIKETDDTIKRLWLAYLSFREFLDIEVLESNQNT